MLEEHNRRYRSVAYVTSDLTNTIIVGNPIINHYPELLNTKPVAVTAAAITSPAADPAAVIEITMSKPTFDTLENLTMGDVEVIFVIQVDAIDSTTDVSVHELPTEPQKEFIDTVSNELPDKPPKKT